MRTLSEKITKAGRQVDEGEAELVKLKVEMMERQDGVDFLSLKKKKIAFWKKRLFFL